MKGEGGGKEKSAGAHPARDRSDLDPGLRDERPEHAGGRIAFEPGPGAHGGSVGSSEFSGAASQEAPALLQKNNRIAEEIGLKGTPTLVWRKSDGTAGEIDGIPKSWEALIAEVEGAHNVSAR